MIIYFILSIKWQKHVDIGFLGHGFGHFTTLEFMFSVGNTIYEQQR